MIIGWVAFPGMNPLPKFYGLLWLRVALIGFVIFSALCLSLFRGLIAGLPFYQDELEAAMSQRLGTSVSLGTVSADLIYLDPQVTIRDLKLGLYERDQLHIQEVSVRLNTLKSLLLGGPVLRDLALIGLVGELRSVSGGGWRLSGFKAPEAPGSFDYVRLLEQAEQIKVESLNLQVLGGQPFNVTTRGNGQGLRLMAEDRQRVLSGGFRLISKDTRQLSFDQDVSIVARFDTPQGSLFSADFEAHLRFTADSSSVIGFGGSQVPALGHHGLDAEFWARSVGGEGVLSGNGIWMSRFKESMTPQGAEIILNSDLSGGFSLADQSLNLRLNLPKLKVMSQSIDLGGIGFSGGADDLGSLTKWAGWLDYLAIDSPAGLALIELGAAVGLSETVKSKLDRIAPKFRLDHLQWSGTSGKFKETFSLVSQIQDLKLEMDGPSPGVEGLAGFIKLGLDFGYLDLNAETLALEFGNLYESPWSLQRGLGRLAYRMSDDGLALTSGKLLAETEGLLAEGKLHMNMTSERRQRTWGLVIGARDFQLREALPFIPNTVPKTSVRWLENSLIGGSARTAGIFVHGSLDRVSPALEKRYEIQIEMVDGKVRFDPEWPPVSNIVGRLGVTNGGLSGTNLESSIYETQADNVDLSVPFSGDGGLSIVSVLADVEGPAANLVRLFKETPLQNEIKNAADQWSGKGAVRGAVKLEVPIGSNGDKPVVETDLVLERVDLDLAEIGLTLSDLNGRLNYESSTGLSSSEMLFTMLDYPVVAQIATELSGNGGTTLIDLAGRVEMTRLNDWLALTLLNFVVGETDFSGRLSIPFGGRDDQPELEVQSLLEGLTIDIPPPLGKAAAENTREFRLSQRFQSKGSELAFNFDSSAGGILRLVDEEVIGGVIEVGGYQPKASAFDAVRIIGALPYASLDAWNLFLQRFDDFSDRSVESQFRSSLDSVKVQAQDFDLFGYALNDVNLGLYPKQDHWEVTLKNDEIEGSVRINDDAEAPLEIALASVNLQSDPADGDPLSILSPDDLMLADVSIESVTLDGEDFGAWQFRVRPSAGVVSIDNLKVFSKGMQIDVPAGLNWYPDSQDPRSIFEGVISVPELRDSLEAWGFASGLEGKDFEFQTVLEWPGSPLNIGIEVISGMVEIEGGQGRIIQAEADAGALKLLGIFDFAEIAQRLSFDLSKILGEGHAFNSVTGSFSVDSGLVSIQNPIIVAGAGSQLTLAGDVNLVTESLDNDLIFTLPLNKNLPWYAAYSAIVTGPLMGAGVLLAQQVFKNQIDELTSLKYEITGTLEQPEVKLVAIFDDSIRSQKAPREENDEK